MTVLRPEGLEQLETESNDFGCDKLELGNPTSKKSGTLQGLGEVAVLGLDAPRVVEGVNRSKEVFRVARNPNTYEVEVESEVTLEDWRNVTRPEDWQLLKDYAQQMQGRSVVFLNPTYEGGGVAMLRPPLVHLLRELGVDARWYVMEGDEEAFKVTKKVHNISQRRLPPDVRLDEEEKQLHRDWNSRNAEVLTAQSAIQTADFVVIDDPQPAPMMPYIAEVNPDARFIWRNHIDTDRKRMSDPFTPQGEVARYILADCGIEHVDAVVCHPVENFIHPGMEDRTYFAPATIERFDDLNRPLSDEEVRKGIAFINDEISRKNEELLAHDRAEDLQGHIDTTRPRLVLVARFDESKGMDKAMELGVLTRQKMRDAGRPEEELPQIIIVGNGSVDDPSGEPMFEKMLELRREKYPKDKKDIILMRLRHNYQAMNALMYRTVGDNTQTDQPPLIAMQTSVAEGCETRITDWIYHGVPVVVSDRGGMRLQVKEGYSGLVLDYSAPDYDLPRGAEWISGLMMDAQEYAAIVASTQERAEEFNNREFSTTANATRLLRVMGNILAGLPADKTWQISQMTR
jgi:alpha,alpha-trehalose phosphorylase (configuration-retaining)